MIPEGEGARDRLWALLVSDQYEDGAYPKFDDLQTIGDIRSHGSKSLIERGITEADAQWLLSQFGGAKRGRKPKEN